MKNIAERQNRILEMLEAQGFVAVSDLSDKLDVSEPTIRRDLRALEERNLLHRTHGGATRTDPYVRDRAVSEKARVRVEEKRRIGEAAAALIEPNDYIILASGTTVQAVARQITGASSLTVITSAMNVAMELTRLQNAEIFMLGGVVRHSSTSVVGPYAEEVLQEYRCDKLFLGVDGFDTSFGLTTTSALEAHLNQAMIRAAQRTIVVADASKFDRRGFRRICGLEDVDRVITDDGVEEAVVRRMEEQGIEVDVV